LADDLKYKDCLKLSLFIIVNVLDEGKVASIPSTIRRFMSRRSAIEYERENSINFNFVFRVKNKKEKKVIFY
jgi:hypothetical protein